MARTAIGNMSEGAYSNPALLGVEKSPKGGLLLAPITDIGAGYWSDKLHLRPYRALFDLGDLGYEAPDTGLQSANPPEYSRLYNEYVQDSIAHFEELGNLQRVYEEVMLESFDLRGLDADAATKKLAEELEGGVKFYTGARLSLLAFNIQRFGFHVETRADVQAHIPEGLLYIPLDGVGLQPGNTLDMSDLRIDALWTTDFRLSLGLPVEIPALHRFFKLKYGAGGVAVKYVMGHSIFHMEADKGELTYTADNEFDVDMDIRLETAGSGLHGPWEFLDGGPFNDGLPVNGHGIGIDAGGILYDDRGSLSISVTDLGVLFWLNDTRKVNYRVDKDDLDVYDVITAMDSVAVRHGYDRFADDGFTPSDYGDEILLELFNRNEDEYMSGSSDTLEETSSFVSMLPLRLDIGYARTWNFSRAKRPGIKYLFEDINLGINYQQQLSNYPGNSFIPRLSIGTEFGTLRNWVPLRIGMILGGPEHFASTLGFGINAKYFQLNAAYKAVGHLFFKPDRGMEVAVGLNVNWGMSTDADKDGIADKDDKCPYQPEDKDKFEDEDGCPDEDNDQDGIKDVDDKCPDVPEDKDNFEDEDGCPDFDNDQDGIPDSTDKCPDEPEDKDNFEDEDGCPEYDNDKDGIPDSTDKCPVLPEDLDNFEDEDGCPEYDNDKDGIPDSTDNCVSKPETYNGYQDQDGCPDDLPKPTEKEQKVLYKKLSAVNFKTGSAELTPASFAHLNFIVDFLKKYPHLRYEVQGHTDSQGGDQYNLLLSAARAGSVRGYLRSKGVPDSALIAIGYGETRPIADNASAKGRAMNRRVEFKVIESKEEYQQKKIQEAEFKSRIQGAKIRGAGKYGW